MPTALQSRASQSIRVLLYYFVNNLIVLYGGFFSLFFLFSQMFYKLDLAVVLFSDLAWSLQAC